MEEPYAVVHFYEQNSYSEIPSNWLLETDESTGEAKCKWPPSFVKNINFHFKHRITPGDDWSTYKVKFMRYCDTLIEARNAAEESDYSASEIPLGKGHRLKFPSVTAAAAAATTSISTTSSSSDSEYDKSDGEKPAAEMPKMDKKAPIIPSRVYRSDTRPPNNHEQSLEVPKSEVIVRNSNTKAQTHNKVSKANTVSIDHLSDSQRDNNANNGDGGDDNECFNTLNDKMDSCLRLLGTLVVEMKDLKQRVVANNDTNCSEVINEIQLEVKNDLPLKSREEVSAFNKKLLESKDYHREFVRVVGQVGGANGKEYTERVLNTIFSTSFAAVNSWEGKKTKYKLNDLKLIKTCEEVILKKFPSWDRAEFSKAGTNWFRLGNQRAGLQKGQKLKKKNPQDTISEDAT